MDCQSESLTKDWINFVVLIKTARNTNKVKNIINAKIKGGISISPKETMNKSGRKFIRIKNQCIKINNKPIKTKNYNL